MKALNKTKILIVLLIFSWIIALIFGLVSFYLITHTSPKPSQTEEDKESAVPKLQHIPYKFSEQDIENALEIKEVKVWL